MTPLHVFADVGSILTGRDAEVLSFVNDLASRSSSKQDLGTSHAENSEDEISDEEDVTTPPATPRAHPMQVSRQLDRDRERERKRLEKLVLEDLNLSMDYRPEPVKKPSVSRVKSWRKVNRIFGSVFFLLSKPPGANRAGEGRQV